jgi:tRNA(Ile)-lysidine synthase
VTARSDAQPLADEAFSRIMAGLGALEPAPRIAVAVSGGADSMALAVLLQDWAAARGGAVLALTVDHGLRAEAKAEAAWVGRVLKACGIQHRILHWRGKKPATSVQARARKARYELLRARCAAEGVLHLALGHHLEDQAETFLLRLGRGSGPEGLAAMAAVVELPELRLLRPLLAVEKSRLEASLLARGIDWLEDPSNRDPAFARVRLRQLMPALAREGLTAARLAETAGRLGRARADLEQDRATLLAKSLWLHPAGYATIDPAPLLRAPKALSLGALARCLMAVGGADYPPRIERLERLYGRLTAGLGRGATLGGCRIVPRRGRLLLVRESARTPTVAVRPGDRLHWDGRFRVTVGGRAGPGRGALHLGPLGREGWMSLLEARCRPWAILDKAGPPLWPGDANLCRKTG